MGSPAHGTSPPHLVDECKEILARRAVAELSIGPPPDERQIGNIVDCPLGNVRAPEKRFGKDVMELQAMLRAAVIQGDREVRLPVTSARITKGEEHRLEQRATLVLAFELLGCDVQSSHLKPETVYQRIHVQAITNRRQVLVE